MADLRLRIEELEKWEKADPALLTMPDESVVTLSERHRGLVCRRPQAVIERLAPQAAQGAAGSIPSPDDALKAANRV
jgi:hypothetical protein